MSYISSSVVSQLPTEIIKEILRHLLQRQSTTFFGSNINCSPDNLCSCRYFTSSSTQNRGNDECESCVCWQLDLLSASMVCKSWYYIGLEMMRIMQTKHKNRRTHALETWTSLINQPTHHRTYPFRAKLIPLLKESCLARLAFHKQVHHLVIDFASFDTIRQERSKHSGDAIVKKIVHNAAALRELTDLLNLCTNVNRLDIVYDAKFTVLTSTGTRDKQHLQKQNIADDSNRNCILSTSLVLQQFFTQHPQIAQRIKCLNFVGFNPNQRCPCCAGKEWDQYLWPLLGSLTSIETITLRNALPTSQVFQTLCENPMLKKIIFHKTMVTLPLRRKKRKIIQTDDTTYSSSVFNSNTTSEIVNSIHVRPGITVSQQEDEYVTSIQQIPSQLWLQVKSIEIYEDIDDVTIPKSRKYLDELALNVGSQLEEFILQFGSEEDCTYGKEMAAVETTANDQYDSKIGIPDITVPSLDPNSPLLKLKNKCKDSLKHILLINVPEF